MDYDIIVVGAGHAGCEAAVAAAKLGNKTLLVTSNIKNIADMPCNPSIGGSAKGIVVREIDALGGVMGQVADRSLLQLKMLNNSRGPAVRALRGQADKITYPKEMIKVLKETKNLTLKEAMVEDLIVENQIVKGIVLEDNKKITSKIVILTTGTYLKSNVLLGSTRTLIGPHGEKPSKFLSENLEKLGFKIVRLKTGTPPRLNKDTIDFDQLKEEQGDKVGYTFSFDKEIFYDVNNQIPCYITYTNDETHKIINKNLNKSSMYGGLDDIKSVGPRYCPSIEDKVVRFSDKERHQLFLEPESLYYDDIYLQGFSTSMPVEVQEKMVHSLKGLENAEILKYAYAIEYDAIYPTQLNQSLETKVIENLFTAGQINGTSGYEEAAGQGLIAGINASLKLKNKEPLILKRNEAYIGVLIDDLVTKGVRDPYRLLTSRAEYRLLLRHDNADQRLTEYGYEIGLVPKKRHNQYKNKQNEVNELIKELKTKKVSVNKKNSTINKTLYELLKTPQITFEYYKNEYNYDPKYSDEIKEIVEITIKYEGYIKKAEHDAKKMLEMESKQIPSDINYDNVSNLASEAKQKLKEIKPTSLGQAIRISGVNPSDIAILNVYLKKEFANDRKNANR